MKCIERIKDRMVDRVSDEKAHKMVDSGSYRFTHKKEWDEKTGKWIKRW